MGMSAPLAAEPASHLPDPTGDRFAVVCARRPVAYMGLRLLAGLVAVVAASFFVDLLSMVAWLVAKVPVLAWWTTGQIGDDVTTVAESRWVLPWPAGRIVVLVSGVCALLACTRWAVHGLPAGRKYMKASVRGHSVWPGRWAPSVTAARRAEPWVVAAAGVLIPLWWWLTQPEDWAHFPLALFLALLAAWALFATVRRGGFWVLQNVPSGRGLTRETVAQAEQDERDRRRTRAERMWPVLPDLRLRCAVLVFAGPPTPSAKGKRVRTASWVGRETSVEDLATELVLRAMLESEAAGMAEFVLDGSDCAITTNLPGGHQPAGLASLVLGRERVGEAPARVPATLSQALIEIAGTDPFANVIDIALADLEALGISRRDPDSGTWQIAAERLVAAGLTATEAESLAADASPRTVGLRTAVRKQIGRRVTTEAGSGTGAQMVAYLFVRHRERMQQRDYALPTVTDGA